MSARKFFGQYLGSPHVDVTHTEPDEDEDGEAILTPIEQAAEPERPNHIPDPNRLRPLPRPAKPLRKPDDAISSGPEDTGRTGEAAIAALPDNVPTNDNSSTAKDTEMTLEDRNRRSEASHDSDESTLGETIKEFVNNFESTKCENIERIIEDNFNTTINRMVQNALYNIIIRRVEAELSTMAKSTSLGSI